MLRNNGYTGAERGQEEERAECLKWTQEVRCRRKSRTKTTQVS